VVCMDKVKSMGGGGRGVDNERAFRKTAQGGYISYVRLGTYMGAGGSLAPDRVGNRDTVQNFVENRISMY
jgi:hypothetical protein